MTIEIPIWLLSALVLCIYLFIVYFVYCVVDGNGGFEDKYIPNIIMYLTCFLWPITYTLAFGFAIADRCYERFKQWKKK